MNLAPIPKVLAQNVRQRIAQVDWLRVNEDLDLHGFAVIGELLTSRDCRTVASFYPDDTNFRNCVVMAEGSAECAAQTQGQTRKRT
jgi:uncharacterized protein